MCWCAAAQEANTVKLPVFFQRIVEKEQLLRVNNLCSLIVLICPKIAHVV